jgi:hypothetical protein
MIEFLYKDRETELKELESAQADMELDEQIEQRIALVKATLSEKGAKSSESPSSRESVSPSQR